MARFEGSNRYVIYTRVSTKGQEQSGLGLEAQERDIALYFQVFHAVNPDRPEQSQFSVLGHFNDIDSGSNDERPEFEKAVAMARSMKATLLVAKLDRLSRRVSKIAALMEEIHFKVATMPYADEFQLHIYAALAEQERKMISLRTKAALASARENGVKLGGSRLRKSDGVDPIALANDVRKRVADASAHRLASVAQPLRDTGLTLDEVAKAMNRAGLTTSKGSQFNATAVKRVLDRAADHGGAMA